MDMINGLLDAKKVLKESLNTYRVFSQGGQGIGLKNRLSQFDSEGARKKMLRLTSWLSRHSFTVVMHRFEPGTEYIDLYKNGRLHLMVRGVFAKHVGRNTFTGSSPVPSSNFLIGENNGY